MTSGRDHNPNPLPIYIKPNNFADYLSHEQDYALFIDIDGTLADFTINPKDSFIPSTTLTLLQELQDCGVKIAAVTGRSLVEAKQMLSPVQLPIAATHGLEIALKDNADGADSTISAVQINTIELSNIKQAISQACTPYPDFTIEDKPYSVALHYRQNPVLADAAYKIMAEVVANYDDWLLKQGKYVWEIMPKGADKGIAILALLAKMQTDKALFPIFIGDDITDEAGFSAVQNERPLDDKELLEKLRHSIKGMAIKVGNEPTSARFYVHDIEKVAVLLASFLEFQQKRAALGSNANDDIDSKKTTRTVI